MKINLLFKFSCAFIFLFIGEISKAQGPDLFHYRFNGSGTSVLNEASSPPSGTDTATINGSMSQGSSGTCGGGALIGTGAASSTDYVSTNWATSLSGSWTISFWTKNVPSTTTLYYIFGDNTAGSFRCFTGGVAGADNWLLRGPFTEIKITGAAASNATVTTFVYDAGTNEIYGYLDGVLNNTVAQSTITISGTGPFKVGSYASNSGLPSGSYMDEFRIYNRALSASEVARLRYLGNSSSSVTVKECASSTYISPSGKVWTTAGTYKDTIRNYYNCDSFMTINLAFGSKSYNTISATACNSYTSPSGNFTWSTSGTYKDSIPNAVGCDSVITVNLTIKKSTAATVTATACNSYSSPNGKVWTVSGTYKDTIPNAVGCDSVITYNLTIKQHSTSSITATACNIYTSPSGKYSWTLSGNYFDTIPNNAGCDSVLSITLTVNYTANAIAVITACDSYTSPSGKYTWTTSGSYVDTLSSIVGCDSIISITLTINNSTSSTISPVSCNTYVSPSGKYLWATGGTYMDTIPNGIGCDSVITINLTVNYATTNTISPVSCNSYTSPSGNVWVTSGMYTDTIPNTAGCDSIITVNLTINNSSTSTLSPTACISYTSPSGKIYTTSGTYTDTIPNGSGCDSIITINLTVNPVNISVTQISFVLIADDSTATGYKWLNCASNYAAIPGETNRTLAVTANGEFAVEITASNSCVDTSACINITNVGTSEIQLNKGMTLYPNPSGGVVTVAFDQALQNATIRIVNIAGQTVAEKAHLDGNLATLDISGEAAGIYFVEVAENGQVSRIKMVKF